MKKFREISEAIKDKFDIGEYDQEGDMAKSDLRSIIANAKRMHDMIEDSDNLPEWVQSKITKAEDYMSTVANYMESEMNEAVKMPKQTRAEKEYRKITGKTVDQRLSELDKIQKNLAKQREDYIKQGIIKAEEVEQVDEVLDTAGKFMSYATKAAVSGLKSAATGTGKFRKRQAGIQTAVRKTKEKLANEEVEIEEGIGGAIAGGVAQFIGNKIDPLHGEIARAHGEVAGRAAEYTIRKHLNKLHSALKKHLSSGAVTEEVEELDEGKYGAFRLGPGVGRFSSRGRAQHQGLEDPRTGLPLGFSNPPKKDEPKKDEPKKVKEDVEHLEEKNVPTSPEKWARAKAQAKAKFDVYPSAYANGWAAKKYKEMGGGWKSVSEESELEEGYFKKQEIEKQETKRLETPFTPDPPKKKSVVVGKKPEGYSRVRQLARQGMQKYVKPVKEENEMSKKAKIVKSIMKKDKFEADPVISKTVDDKES